MSASRPGPSTARRPPASQPARPDAVGRTSLAAHGARRPVQDSLQLRVAVLTGLAVAVAVVIVGGAGFAVTRYALVHQVDQTLSDIALQARPTMTGQASDVAGFDAESQVLAGNATIAVVTSEGVLQPPAAVVRIEPGADERAVAAGTLGHSARSTTASDGRPYRMVAVPLDRPGTALVVARPLAGPHAILRRLTEATLGLGALGVALAVVVGASVARSSLRPVRELTAAVESVTRNEDLTPVRVEGHHELSRLALEFNRMLRSLALAREQQARLIADAGHELRTPLTSLRTNFDLLELDQQAGLLDAQARRAMLADMKEQLAEFTTLISDLVQLARDDRSQPTPEPVDLEVVLQAALRRARRRGSDLHFAVATEPYFVLGEATALERALTNLLDNAVKFSPPGGTVRVELTAAADTALVRVADEGPGVPEQDLPKVFDRFYRSDTSRNKPGTGLGLSIVAQTAARHHGWVRADRAPEGGAEFSFCLPGATCPDRLPQRRVDAGVA